MYKIVLCRCVSVLRCSMFNAHMCVSNTKRNDKCLLSYKRIIEQRKKKNIEK